jgi:hypothetical protein
VRSSTEVPIINYDTHAADQQIEAATIIPIMATPPRTGGNDVTCHGFELYRAVRMTEARRCLTCSATVAASSKRHLQLQAADVLSARHGLQVA